MKKLNVRKILSTSLSLALAVTSAPLPAGAAGPMATAPAFATRLTPPEQFGYVASSFAPGGEEHPRLILISDLHGHVEVQKNIIGIMDSLVSHLTSGAGASQQVPIYVEGGWVSKLEEPLSFIKNQGVRSFMREYLMRKSEIGAAQAYSETQVGTNKVTLTGVEDKALYEANRKQFAKTYPVRKAVLQALLHREESLKALAEVIEPSAFLKLQKLQEDYNKGKVSPERYAKVLSSYSRRFRLQGNDVEAVKNISSATSLDGSLARVHRAVLFELSKQKPMMAWMRQTLEQEDLMRNNIARIESRMDLLKRLVSNQLTPDEVPMALADMPQLTWIAKQLLQHEGIAVDVEKVLRDSLDFYPFAILRDKALVKNAMTALNANASKASTGILVVGGFHTQAIADYLRSQKIAYLDIRPNVSRDLTTREQLNYVKRLCNEHITLDEVKGDMALLRSGKTATSGAAIGQVVSLMTPEGTSADVAKNLDKIPGDPDVNHMSGIVGVAKAMDAAFDTAVDAHAALAGADAGAVALVRGAVTFSAGKRDIDSPVAAERWDNIRKTADILADEGFNVDLGPISGTITREGNKFVNAEADSPVAKAMQRVADMATSVFNTVAQTSPNDLHVINAMDVQVVGAEMIKTIKQKMATGQIEDIVETEHAVIINARSLRPVIYVTSLEDTYGLGHEMRHAFDDQAQQRKEATPEAQQKEKERAEKVAIIAGAVLTAAINKGTAIAEINGNTQVSYAAVAQALKGVAKRLPKGAEFHTTLAMVIANLMNPVTLQNSKSVAEWQVELQAQFDVPEYTIQKHIKAFLNNPVNQMAGINDPKDPTKLNPDLKGEIDEVKEGIASDAKKINAVTPDA